MFGDHAFRSWLVIFTGAVVFAALFTLLALMVEQVFEGEFRMTPAVLGFGVAAFLGYLGTALILRRSGPPSEP